MKVRLLNNASRKVQRDSLFRVTSGNFRALFGPGPGLGGSTVGQAGSLPSCHPAQCPFTSYDRSVIMSLTAPIVAFYDYALRPIPALAWVGAPISTLDVAGALRLALILRQLRELFHKEHLAKMSLGTGRVKNEQLEKASAPVVVPPERRSCVRNFAAGLVMVFGGEIVVGALRIWHLLRQLGPSSV